MALVPRRADAATPMAAAAPAPAAPRAAASSSSSLGAAGAAAESGSKSLSAGLVPLLELVPDYEGANAWSPLDLLRRGRALRR